MIYVLDLVQLDRQFRGRGCRNTRITSAGSMYIDVGYRMAKFAEWGSKVTIVPNRNYSAISVTANERQANKTRA